MPHFCKCGRDQYICQRCTQIKCSGESPSAWVAVNAGESREGNLCPSCILKEGSNLTKILMSTLSNGEKVNQEVLDRYNELITASGKYGK